MPEVIFKGKSVFYKFFANLLWVVGIVNIFYGIFLVIFSLIEKDLGLTGPFILVGALFGLVPFYFGHKMRKKYKSYDNFGVLRKYEQLVLRCIAENENVINAATLSLKTGLSLAEANYALEQLTKNGFLNPEIDENGSVYYVCSQLIKK